MYSKSVILLLSCALNFALTHCSDDNSKSRQQEQRQQETWQQDMSDTFKIEGSDQGIQKVNLKCGSNSMNIVLETEKPFTGVMYTRGSFYKQTPPCFVSSGAQNTHSLEMSFQLDQCQTLKDGELYSNVVVIQNDPDLITPGDSAFSLECDFRQPRSMEVNANMQTRDRIVVGSRITLTSPDPSVGTENTSAKTVHSVTDTVAYTPKHGNGKRLADAESYTQNRTEEDKPKLTMHLAVFCFSVAWLMHKGFQVENCQVYLFNPNSIIMDSLLVLLFLVSGTCNVLLIKWSNTLLAECRDGKWRNFQHPIVQTAILFLGEYLFFLVYKCVLRLRRCCRSGDSQRANLVSGGGGNFTPLSMLLPSFLQTITSVLLFTGLYLTYASSFQMIRSSGLIFVGLLGSMHLNQTLVGRHWSAMITIACAITILVATDLRRVLYDSPSLSHADVNAVLTGDLLVICAQIFYAAKVVYEEKYLKDNNIPAIQAIGWQGLMGFAITGVLCACTNFLPTPLAPFNENSRAVFDDLYDLKNQFLSNPWLLVALSLFMVSSALYGYLTLCIIKFSSTSNLLLADGMRAYFVWLIAVLLEWEQFNLVMLLGFVILQMGLVTYRKAIVLEWYRSLLIRLARTRATEATVEQEAGGTPTNRPADVI